MPENQNNKNAQKLLRIKHIIKYMGFRSDKEFANAISISQAYLSEITSNKKNVPKTLTQKLTDTLNINPSWFENGDGNMFVSEEKISSKTYYSESNQNNPFTMAQFNEEQGRYEIHFTGNLPVPIFDQSDVLSINEIFKSKSVPPVALLLKSKFKGCDLIIKHSDSDIDKVIPPNSWIGIEKLDDWQEEYYPGKLYVVVLKKLRVERYIFPGKSDDTVILKAVQKGSELDFEVDKTKILEVWLVRAHCADLEIRTLI